MNQEATRMSASQSQASKIVCWQLVEKGTMSGMSQWWPLLQLRLQTPRLELRAPSDSDLDALASVAASGVHDPGVQPFAVPWTDCPPAERARSVLQHHWSQRAAWKPESWTLDFVVVRDGAV